jgi:hypothetical protein
MDCDMTSLAKYAFGFLGTNAVTNSETCSPGEI